MTPEERQQCEQHEHELWLIYCAALEELDTAMRAYTHALTAGKGMPLEWLPEFVAEQAARFRLKELSDAAVTARHAWYTNIKHQTGGAA